MNAPVPTPTAPLDAPTVSVTLLGRDHAGVTARLFEVVAPYDVEVIDVEQIVLRGRLVLAVLLTEPADREAFERSVADVASELDMDHDVSYGQGDNRGRRRGRSHVTVLGAPLLPSQFSAVTAQIAAAGGNIDRIVRMARYPVTAIDLDVSGAAPEALRRALALEAARQGVDVAVQPLGIHQHAQRLVVMDVDSTLIQGEVIEMIAAYAGCEKEVAEVTAAAMRGELDFADSLRERVALLEGVDVSVLGAVYESIQLAPGARTMIRTLKRLGYRFALVSGGFTQIIDTLAADLGIDYWAANTLEVRDGRLTGRVAGPVIDRAGKAAALRRFAEQAGITVANTVAIGDGANDLDMLAEAGLGIAFNAKPAVRDAADASLSVPYLDAIVFLLGITREEIEAADAEVAATDPQPGDGAR
ncbi:phosphoserine phosphatase SerB [Mumia sp. zg.B17]|uniref:phosphoserine phosphatase SerB n=1 Tax=Mumia sp. zg.B17 TaxID=2855446 RepID=UPI001C6E9FF9|nr:phosphoserine phosphatase SerB [Mumia sp. zg.B17]MBW9205150.1 phosphoserine phosphatase SerB [Mumia sp. zg.B17]